MKLIEILNRVDYNSILLEWDSECNRINALNQANQDKAPSYSKEGWQCYEIFSWGVNKGFPSSIPDIVSCPITARSIGFSLSEITEGELTNNRGVKYLCKPYTIITKEEIELIPLPNKPGTKTMWEEVKEINPLITYYCKGGGYRTFYPSKTESGENYKYISYCFEKVNRLNVKVVNTDEDNAAILEVTKYYTYHHYRFFTERIEIWKGETSEALLYKNGVKYYYPTTSSSDSYWSDQDGFLSPGYD